jgi:hypothetical protein
MNNETNEQTINKVRKEGQPHGRPPLKVQCIKIRERQLLVNCVLHSKTIVERVKILLSEILGEYASSLFKEG